MHSKPQVVSSLAANVAPIYKLAFSKIYANEQNQRSHAHLIWGTPKTNPRLTHIFEKSLLEYPEHLRLNNNFGVGNPTFKASMFVSCHAAA